MFKFPHRYLTAVLAGVAALPLVTACGGDTGATADNCQNAQVKMGALGSSSDALLFIAETKGYFKDQGGLCKSLMRNSTDAACRNE
jgi:ABC-type nitrate/sulfonate/bicarbonate transport system substrate-binding protein